MGSRGDEIRRKSGKLNLLLAELCRIRYRLEKDETVLSDPKTFEELAFMIYERWTKEQLEDASNLFKEIYNAPGIPLD